MQKIKVVFRFTIYLDLSFYKKNKKVLDKLSELLYNHIRVKDNKFLCLGGEIGRRTGLKILWNFFPCRFKSGPRHHFKTIIYIRNDIAGQSSLVARRAHNPKVVGSNPAPATKCLDSSVGQSMRFIPAGSKVRILFQAPSK